MNYFSVLQGELQAMGRAAIATLPSIVIAMVVLTVAWLAARFAASIVRRITGHTHLRGDLRELLETLVKVAIWVVGFLLAATIVIPGFTFGGMIAGLGIGAVAIGFAFQDIFQNFLAGVLIMLRDKMRIGDIVECDKIKGKVEHISLRETHIRQLSGELTIVPNSTLFKNPVEIITDRPLRRDEIMVPVEFGSDVEAAKAAVENAIATVEAVDTTQPVQVFAQKFDTGAGVTELIVRWWTDAVANNIAAVRSEVMLAVLKAFGDAGIALPTSTTELLVSDEQLAKLAPG